GLLTQFGNAQEKVGKARMGGEQALIAVGRNDGFKLRAGKGAFDGRNRTEKRVHRPRQNEFGPRTLCAEVVLQPAFLLLVDACCDLEHARLLVKNIDETLSQNPLLFKCLRARKL